MHGWRMARLCRLSSRIHCEEGRRCGPIIQILSCACLQVDAAADAELRKLQPSLCGRGALVNVGPMRLAWPRPPTQQQQQRRRPQPQRQHGQEGQQQQQQQQREEGMGPTAPRSGGSLTGGAWSGRAVKDSDDLW